MILGLLEIYMGQWYSGLDLNSSHVTSGKLVITLGLSFLICKMEQELAS